METYANDIQALQDSIKVVFQLNQNEFKLLASKYDDAFKSKSGQIEFEELLANNISQVNTMISKSYKRKMLSKYYSEYGIISVIHDSLKQLYLDFHNNGSQGEIS